MRPKLLKTLNFLLLAFLLLATTQVSGQILLDTAPVPAPNQNPPNNGSGGAWPFICASEGFNEYFVDFSWQGTPDPTNQFVLELSDASGSFDVPVTLATEAGQNTTNGQFFLEFALPPTTQGEGYRLRMRSTLPARESPASEPFAMYYQGYTSNFNISPNGDGSTVSPLNSAVPVTFTVDDIQDANTYTYRWYRSGTLLESSPGVPENGISILADTNGIYQAYIFYGDACTGASNAFSNTIDFSLCGGNQGLSIDPPTNTALCSGQTETLQANPFNAAWTYQWYKDGAAISGANSDSFTVDADTAGFEGDYEVEISGTGICTERSPAVAMTNAGGFTVTRDNSANVVVLPAQPVTLSVSTTATSPSFQWYRDTAPISGATTNTLDITQDGVYYCAVTTTGACASTVDSEITTAVVPDSFEVLIGYNPTDYQDCVNSDVVLEVVTINAITGIATSDVTSQLVDSFMYQWNLDGNLITGATTKTISLADVSDNGAYTVDAVLNSYADESNSLSVQLLTNETLTINSTGTVFCSGGDTITISTSTDLSSETYNWERDGVSTGAATPTLAVADTGTYRLALNRNGCTLYSNEIAITGLDPNLIQLDVDGDVVFPEGSSRTVTATGGSAYQWFDAGNNIVSSTDSMTFTEEGEFTLVASVDNCSVTRQLTAVYLELFNIPNVITPNGDGANDQWVIPNSYSNKTDVNVIIYDDKGKEQLNITSYQNNWPESSMAFPKQNMVFYYVIKNANQTLKQGTITVIR